MKIHCKLIIFLFVCFVWQFGVVQVEASDQTDIATLNISQDQMNHIGPIHLTGQWDYYRNEYLAMEEIDARIMPAEKFTTDDWEESLSVWRDATRSTGTYHFKMKIHPDDVGTTAALYVPIYGEVYDLFLDDTLLIHNTKIDKKFAPFTPLQYQDFVAFTMESAEFNVVLHVYELNESVMESMIPTTIGTKNQIIFLKGGHLLFQVCVGVSAVIIGLYHLIVYMYRKQEVASLFLSLACFALVLRVFFIQETLLIHMFFDFSWDFIVKIEFISGLIALLFFFLFIKNILYFPKFKQVSNFLLSLILLYMCFIVVSPSSLFIKWHFLYQLLTLLVFIAIIIITVVGLYQKQAGAVFNFIGLFVLFLSTWDGVFHYSDTITTNEFISFGHLVYLFMMSIYLARKSAKSFHEVEMLSLKLVDLNTTLEQRVINRTEKLVITNEHLQMLEESRKRLFQRVSHELNTPITFIHGYVKAMMDGVVPSDDSSYLRAVYKDTEMMSHMIADLQELSQLESGQIRFRFNEVSMRDFMRKVWKEEKTACMEANVNCTYSEEIDPRIAEPIMCEIDMVRIKQVMNNLIVNALKYSPENSEISIKFAGVWRKENPVVKISVTDNGAGISQRDLPYLFDRFYKVHDVNNIEKAGTGVGLAICKEIIDYHKGEIGVSSEKEVGSTFYFTLPIRCKGESENGERNSVNH